MRTAVHIHDLSFAPFISETTIQTRIKEIASQLSTDFNGKDPIFLVVLNGAFMFASDLFKQLTCKPELTFVKVSSYVGTQSSGRVDELIGLQTSLHNRHVIVLEDILDTGVTMDKMHCSTTAAARQQRCHRFTPEWISRRFTSGA